MRCLANVVVATILLVPAVAFSQDKIYSGPQPGEDISPFKVLQVTTADEVEEMEIASADAKGPTLICFMHKTSEPAVGLFINLEYYASKHDKINKHFVLLTEDREKTEKMLRRWAKNSFFTNAHMSISVDGAEGPGDYGLNRNVTATVLVANNNKVVKSFAYQDPNGEDAGEILEALAKTAGLEKPSLDELRKEIRSRRDERRAMRMKQNPVFKLAPNEKLGQLMMRMMYTEGDREANAKQRAKQMLEWAGDDEEKLSALKKYCKAMLEGEFEINEYSRKALKKLAEGKK